VTLYRTLKNKAVWTTSTPPDGAQSILLVGNGLLPPLITQLHRNFRAWSDAGLSPGPIEPARLFVSPEGGLTFAFPEKGAPELMAPQPLAANVGAARDLAGWLILLDKWMETFVVLARARHAWSTSELASALPFLSPIYQSSALIEMPPLNWERVARALAQSVIDGPLQGGDEDEGPENKHWQKEVAKAKRPARKRAKKKDDAEEPSGGEQPE
jgi:hypothetical protein